MTKLFAELYLEGWEEFRREQEKLRKEIFAMQQRRVKSQRNTTRMLILLFLSPFIGILIGIIVNGFL